MKPLPAFIAKLQVKIHAQSQHKTRAGRHRAPFQLNKSYLRAGAIAAAVAAVGGIAAVSLTSSLASAAPSASIRWAGRHVGSAHSRPARTRPARVSRAPDATGPHSTSAAPNSSRPASPSQNPALAPAHRRPTAGQPSVAAVRCSGTSGMLPQNYAAIVSFLIGHGYTKMAAAGIAGNIYQESIGNPESVGTGGGGLIGWTPLPAGFVTGNPAADLRTQLEALLTYNQQWAQYIPMLNAATSPTQAADIYMSYFERPGIPAAYNREGAAAAVASACGF